MFKSCDADDGRDIGGEAILNASPSVGVSMVPDATPTNVSTGCCGLAEQAARQERGAKDGEMTGAHDGRTDCSYEILQWYTLA